TVRWSKLGSRMQKIVQFIKKLPFGAMLFALGMVLAFATVFKYSAVSSDFDHDYQAALRLLARRPVYSADVAIEKITASPPLHIVMLTPLVLFPRSIAFMILGAVSYLSLAGGLFIVAQKLGW